jgi:hypothetical protein
MRDVICWLLCVIGGDLSVILMICWLTISVMLAHLRWDNAAVLCSHSQEHGPHRSPCSGHEMAVTQTTIGTWVVLPQVSIAHMHDVAGTLQQSGSTGQKHALWHISIAHRCTATDQRSAYVAHLHGIGGSPAAAAAAVTAAAAAAAVAMKCG